MLIIPEKEKAIKSIQVLRASPTHLVIYSDGSKVEGRNTAAAAWCENTEHCNTHQLGKETEFGIFEAEYQGFILALQLMKHSFQRTTRQATIVLDNQGVVKDMATKKTTSKALSHKTEAIELIRQVWVSAPHVRITLRWCPGHKGIVGNERADKLANTLAKKPLPPSHKGKSTPESFRAAIKAWAEKESSKNYSPQDLKRLGHDPQSQKHTTALNKLKNKHSVSSITQLRTGHIPLFQYLAKQNLRPDPTCVCGTGLENVDHFLFLCPLHEEQRAELIRELDDLNLPLDRTILNYPDAFEPIANYTSSTWRLQSRWDWAEIHHEAVPKGKLPPT